MIFLKDRIVLICVLIASMLTVKNRIQLYAKRSNVRIMIWWEHQRNNPTAISALYNQVTGNILKGIKDNLILLEDLFKCIFLRKEPESILFWGFLNVFHSQFSISIPVFNILQKLKVNCSEKRYT